MTSRRPALRRSGARKLNPPGRRNTISSVFLSRRRLIASAARPLLSQAAPYALRIVVTGGHPGDPECGCGGTIARYVELGQEVTLLYLNRGEGFCGGASLDRCAAIRTAEAEEACRILKARAVFAGQHDGGAIVDDPHQEAFARLLAAQDPGVIFTHWPDDTHADHRAIAALTLTAWRDSGRKSALYYYEVAEDTLRFAPDEYVDITAVESRRRAACYAHASQQPGKWYPKQVDITRRRGAESGFTQAEAFLRHPESRRVQFP